MKKTHQNKGIPKSLEHRAKISRAMAGKPSSHGYTQDIRNKISQSLIGRKRSLESRFKQSISTKGRKQSAEAVEKRAMKTRGANHWAWKGGISTYERKLWHNSQRRARLKGAQGSFTEEQWKALKLKYNHMCLCCKMQEPFIKLTYDHIVPLINGGDNTISNIQPLCRSCNCKKNAKTIDFTYEHSN